MASGFGSDQTMWHNKRISAKSYSFPRHFLCFKNYKLNGLIHLAAYARDIPRVLNSQIIVKSKYSNAKFEFSLDKFFTFALRTRQWLLLVVWLQTESFYVSSLFHIFLTCFIKIVIVVLYLVYADVSSRFMLSNESRLLTKTSMSTFLRSSEIRLHREYTRRKQLYVFER